MPIVSLPASATAHGTIYDAFNVPLTGVTVEASDKDLRSEQLLGSAVTDANGAYSITYTDQQYAGSEYKTADVFIRVYHILIGTAAPVKQLLGTSAVVFNAGADLLLDFKTDNSPISAQNEFDALVALITSLTDPQKVAIADLQENETFKDISFLSGETGTDAAKIALLPTAYQFSAKTKIAADIFYGLFRMQYPTDLTALLQVKADSITNGINSAIAKNIISAKWTSQISTIVQSFNQLATEVVLGGTGTDNVSFAKLTSTALTAQQQNDFVNVYLASESNPDTFWDTLSKQNGFTDAKTVTGVKNLLQLNLLTANEPTLTNLLFNEINTTQPAALDISALAGYTEADLKAKIDGLVSDGSLTAFPDFITGADNNEKSTNYANAMTLAVKQLFSTAVFASGLAKDNSNAFSSRTDLKTFLANNSAFDLKTTKIDTDIKAANLTGITNAAALKNDLQTISRLSKLSDDYSHVSALVSSKLTSATAIVKAYSPTSFATAFSASIGKDAATEIYSNAVIADRRSTAVALSLKMRNDFSVYVINGSNNDASPDYESLFGDTNCDCDECQSVYSPSAYLTDILNFLKQDSGTTAFNVLTGRRPDIINILLTCENTNTPLPYIDLVNELLETTISPVTTGDQWPQTTLSTEELAAYPEHINPAAYNLLGSSIAAFKLPYNLALEETRLYLGSLGFEKFQLMELYSPAGQPKYQDISIASEYLQLLNAEMNIINGVSPAFQLPVALGNMVNFLSDTGLSYMEALQLFECNLINPLKPDNSKSILIVAVPGADEASCDITKLKLQSGDSQSLNILPFIRMWKKLGWDIFDLDRVFTALNIKSFTAGNSTNLIIPLSVIARLKAKYKISVQNICSFWDEIDTFQYHDHSIDGQPAIPTLFQNLFQNKKVTNPLDPDFSNPLALQNGPLSQKDKIVMAAFNLSQDDFNTLSRAPYVDGSLTLQNLGVIYRYTVFAAMLKISVSDFISLIALTGIVPLGTAVPKTDALVFIDKAAFIKTSGFAIAELSNWLGITTATTAPVDVNNTAKVLGSIRDGLQKIELLGLVGATDTEKAANKKQNQNGFITDTIGTAFKTESKVINLLINDLVNIPFGNSNTAVNIFLDPVFINSTGSLFTIATDNSITWQFPSLVDGYQVLLNTWNRIASLLVKWKISNDEFIYFQTNEIKFGIEGIWNLPVTGTNLYAAWENVYNLILFRNVLAVKQADWFLLFDSALTNNTGAKPVFLTGLSSLTNISTDDIQFLTGTTAIPNGKLNFNFPNDYLLGANLVQIINCAGNATKLGSSTSNISLLASALPAEDYTPQSALAQSILKSKYDDAGWLNVITPISKKLRVEKRDALLSYLLYDASMAAFRTAGKITDTNSLYAWFLIDLQMDACMFTSRIKQAISSIQLFIDRCLLNLETGISLYTDFASQWNDWRSRYRIWEANRKIFLYPENWIEPELRDNKTSFFTDLESTLRQNEVTDDIITDALLTYLEKLDTVANLEIIGHFPDTATGILHVIGRMRNLPQQYYYNSQQNQVWKSWEKIDPDIEGDYVLPVVWNNRVMLFWAILSSKEESSSGGFLVPQSGDVMPPPQKSMILKLAWSEYKKGGWTAKQTSNQVVTLISFLRLTEEMVSLSSFIDGEKLYIRVFFPVVSDITNNTVWNASDQTFLFDGCHSAPSIAAGDFTVPGLREKFVARISGTNVSKMFITEINKDNFSVLDNGIQKQYVASALAETTLLQNTPGKFRVQPGHHQIEDSSPSHFFYNNEQNNFYVTSYQRTFPASGLLTVATSALLTRAVQQPVLVSTTLQNTQTAVFTNAVHAVQPALSLHSNLTAATGIINSNTNVGTVLTNTTWGLSFFAKKYGFQAFYHPYVCELIKTLNTDGVDGIYKKQVPDVDGIIKEGIQNRIAVPVFVANGAYNPTAAVSLPYPAEQFDFDLSAVYSVYNWELFFHIPLLLATRLSQNQQFEAARKWFHYIFDPTQASLSAAAGPERFWITKPFKQEILNGMLSIEDLLNNPSNNPSVQNELDAELKAWEQNLFDPHAIARLRHSAYMRSTVMKYIDNLVAWGDQLFQTDTLETINEATLLYVTAANLLGTKPDKIPARAQAAQYSFSDIQNKLDSFSNAKVAIESYLSLSAADDGPAITTHNGADNKALMSMFCIPKNDMMLGYWDTVADRLFKIRHCLNIEGVFQQLPLFEPPIDPGLLVKAGAAGLDLNNILNEMTVSLPNYRFQVMLQKANELCNEVKALGSQLLSALEKKDGEQLALLHSTHELSMLQVVRDVKAAQVDEATENLNSLNDSLDVIQARQDYYSSRDTINSNEAVYLASIPMAMLLQNMAISAQALGAIGHALPDVTIGPFSSGATDGGANFGNAMNSAGASFNQHASLLTAIGQMSNTIGGFNRRQDDWTFQAQSANLEIKQMNKQIAAAQIRLAIAQKELDNHDLQIDQSQETDSYLRSKFTNEDLYDYMISQLSAVYFQGYQLAYSTAKKAETCFRYELGIDDSSFMQFGYWDSLKKGLLAGEKLQYDLRRLENAYLEKNSREYEMVKNISVAVLNPFVLQQLKETGACIIDLPEALFDLDCAGQYFRRIKSVSISIPCIAGPYTSVNCTLTNQGSKIRKQATLNTNKYAEDTGGSDTRFVYSTGTFQSIATSNAQNDSGMFELNFRDERYLPFEGLGAISSWKMELNGKYKDGDGAVIDLSQFDFNSISDVIIHLKYTSRDGGEILKTQAATELTDAINVLIKDLSNNKGLFTAVDLRREFPDAWYRFITNADTGSNHTMQATFTKNQLPFFVRNNNITINSALLLLKLSNSAQVSVSFTQPAFVATKGIIGEFYSGSWNINQDLGDGLLVNLQPGNIDFAANPPAEMILLIGYQL